METWILGKLQTASDESYRDPTNLLAKLQKHQAFEAELTANKARVESVAKVSERWLCVCEMTRCRERERGQLREFMETSGRELEKYANE